MLDQITPLILTYNEAPNIGRALEHLRWARDIVVVDSFSNDGTVELVNRFPNSRVVQRIFDTHAAQWNFGLSQTGISTDWVLALDADYCLTAEMTAELSTLRPSANAAGYKSHFIFCINGRQVRSALYPPVVVLYQRAFAKYIQDGHTQRLQLDGPVDELRVRLLHDDRKPLSRWFQSQQRYMALEALKLRTSDKSSLSTSDRVRRLRVVAPVAVLLYCLIFRLGVLDGWAGFYYAFQRMVAELMLSLNLLEGDPWVRSNSEPHGIDCDTGAAELTDVKESR
jgi:hypothetical protein